MKKLLMTGLCVGLLAASLSAEAEWKTSTTGDGLVTVKSRLSERTNEAGKKAMVIEYEARARATMRFADAVAVLRDIEHHKLFLEEQVSERVKTVSDHEWVVYYTFSAPWPMPSSDCVATMTATEDAAAKTALFSLRATPAAMEARKVDRMTYYNVTYGFRDLGGGVVEFVTTGRISPLVQVPDWMMSAFFPDGPAKLIRLITAQAKGTLTK